VGIEFEKGFFVLKVFYFLFLDLHFYYGQWVPMTLRRVLSLIHSFSLSLSLSLSVVHSILFILFFRMDDDDDDDG